MLFPTSAVQHRPHTRSSALARGLSLTLPHPFLSLSRRRTTPVDSPSLLVVRFRRGHEFGPLTLRTPGTPSPPGEYSQPSDTWRQFSTPRLPALSRHLPPYSILPIPSSQPQPQQQGPLPLPLPLPLPPVSRTHQSSIPDHRPRPMMESYCFQQACAPHDPKTRSPKGAGVWYFDSPSMPGTRVLDPPSLFGCVLRTRRLRSPRQQETPFSSICLARGLGVLAWLRARVGGPVRGGLRLCGCFASLPASLLACACCALFQPVATF